MNFKRLPKNQLDIIYQRIKKEAIKSVQNSVNSSVRDNLKIED